MKSDKNWCINFKNCPHCFCDMGLTIISNESDKDCVSKLVKYMIQHSVNCNMNSLSRKKTNITICERKIQNNFLITKYISSVLFI